MKKNAKGITALGVLSYIIKNGIEFHKDSVFRGCQQSFFVFF